MGSYKAVYFKDQWLLEWLEREARESGLSFSAFVAAILEAYSRTRGATGNENNNVVEKHVSGLP